MKKSINFLFTVVSIGTVAAFTLGGCAKEKDEAKARIASSGLSLNVKNHLDPAKHNGNAPSFTAVYVCAGSITGISFDEKNCIRGKWDGDTHNTSLKANEE